MDQPAYESLHQMGKIPKVLIYLMLGFFPLLGIALFLLGVYGICFSIVYDGETVWRALVLIIPVVLAVVELLVIGWLLTSSGLAHYRFEENGLWVKYPFRKPILIPWEDFQQVCVVRHGKYREFMALCCVKKGEKLDGGRRWKVDNLLHYRSVITIEYTPELHQGLIERCTQQVVDLRETMAYKKYW